MDNLETISMNAMCWSEVKELTLVNMSALKKLLFSDCTSFERIEIDNAPMLDSLFLPAGDVTVKNALSLKLIVIRAGFLENFVVDSLPVLSSAHIWCDSFAENLPWLYQLKSFTELTLAAKKGYMNSIPGIPDFDGFTNLNRLIINDGGINWSKCGGLVNIQYLELKNVAFGEMEPLYNLLTVGDTLYEKYWTGGLGPYRSAIPDTVKSELIKKGVTVIQEEARN